MKYKNKTTFVWCAVYGDHFVSGGGRSPSATTNSVISSHSWPDCGGFIIVYCRGVIDSLIVLIQYSVKKLLIFWICRYSLNLNVENKQTSFWRLFWHQAPYFVIVNHCAYIFAQTYHWLLCHVSGMWMRGWNWMHSSREKQRFLWQVKICLFHNMQWSMLIKGSGMKPRKLLIYYEWF